MPDLDPTSDAPTDADPAATNPDAEQSALAPVKMVVVRYFDIAHEPLAPNDRPLDLGDLWDSSPGVWHMGSF